MKVVSFFYLKDSSTAAGAPQLLDGIPTRCQEIILTNMKQAASLTLWILKSVYLRADLDVAGECFMVTGTDEEALKLVEDSAMTADHILDMVSIDMS
jgi:hypothetical protein